MEQVLFSFERFEEKYLLTEEKLQRLLERLGDRIQMDSYGRHTIGNIYFDNDNYDIIQYSLTRPMYKEKFRLRCYGVPDNNSKVYAELKKKYNHIVYKRRFAATMPQIEDFIDAGISVEGNEQIQKEIKWFMDRQPQKPKCFIGYEREAYTFPEEPELRMTLDRNLRYRTDRLDLREGCDGELIMEENPIVLEIKYPGTSPVWLGRLLSELDILPITFSKYGAAYRRHLCDESVRDAMMLMDSYRAVYGRG